MIFIIGVTRSFVQTNGTEKIKRIARILKVGKEPRDKFICRYFRRFREPYVYVLNGQVNEIDAFIKRNVRQILFAMGPFQTEKEAVESKFAFDHLEETEPEPFVLPGFSASQAEELSRLTDELRSLNDRLERLIEVINGLEDKRTPLVAKWKHIYQDYLTNNAGHFFRMRYFKSVPKN